ncbi:tetraspanin-8-like [Hoplias malabaricus]|uniref:tetraspanin-8-like n=1 Tax=Hoplias malabaricus TaxID=27720 RepID=UPI003461A6B5
MASLNPCFKKTFVFFNILFAIFGLVILGLAIVGHLQPYDDQDSHKFTGVIVLVIFGSVTFIVAVLGAYGAHKENKNVLIAFFVLMCAGSIILLRIAIPMAINRDEVMSVTRQELEKLPPLDHTSSDFKKTMDFVQEQIKCCGLFKGYQDWGSNVPDSCNCQSTEVDECQEITTYGYLGEYLKPRMVYTQPCGFIFMEYLDMIFAVTLGLLFGFAALAILGTVMSLAMILRITSPTVSPPAVFSLSPHPPKYSELIQTA